MAGTDGERTVCYCTKRKNVAEFNFRWCVAFLEFGVSGQKESASAPFCTCQHAIANADESVCFSHLLIRDAADAAADAFVVFG